MAANGMAAAEQKEESGHIELGEKPVREQLEKASIDGTQNGKEKVIGQSESAIDNAAHKAGVEDDEIAPKAGSRKVSPEPTRHHTRKRSRDSTVEELERSDGLAKTLVESTRSSFDEERHKLNGNGTTAGGGARFSSPEPHGDTPQDIASPKTKRSRLISTTAENGGSTRDVQEETAGSASTLDPVNATISKNGGAPESADSAAKAEDPKTPEVQTSSSAFAASGFGALASSSTSGFGSIGKSTGVFGPGGSFATSVKSIGPTMTKTAPDQVAKDTSSSAFGGALGKKAAFAAAAPAAPNGFDSGGFLSGGSGFGQLGQAKAGFGSSGFGSLAGSSGLTSFGSGKQATFGGAQKPVKAFGAPADDDNEEGTNDDDDDDDTGAKSPLTQESDRQDERFYEQDVETGEENEDTRFTCRAKLYSFTTVTAGKKEWKERGLGTLRLNVTRPGVDSTSKVKARLVMRADGSHRVVLNTPVRKEIKFGNPHGNPPEGSYFFFGGSIDGGVMELLQLKMKAPVVQELYEKIKELQNEM